MKRVIFALPGNEALAKMLAKRTGATLGRAIVRRFPDGETYVRIGSEVRKREVVLVCSLDRPDEKFLGLCFLAATARDFGAIKVGLVCPYLSYMRQDKRFRKGEGITSAYFGEELSCRFDWIVTVDPHLHRRQGMKETYAVPVGIVHAAPLLARWIRRHVPTPIVIGPDAESAQWVTAVARAAGAEYLVLKKRRSGDRRVDISPVRAVGHKLGTPVIVDDIISTARTMAVTVQRLRAAGYPAPYCIGIHGIFADQAIRELKRAGAKKIITSNTIPHASNAVDVTPLLVDALEGIDAGNKASRSTKQGNMARRRVQGRS